MKTEDTLENKLTLNSVPTNGQKNSKPENCFFVVFFPAVNKCCGVFFFFFLERINAS